MHRYCLRTTDGFAGQTLNPRPSCAMFSCNFLSSTLTYCMMYVWNMALIGSPILCIQTCDMQGSSQFFSLYTCRICLFPKDRSQYFSRVMIESMPQPALLTCMPNTTPHGIHCCFINLLEDSLHGFRWCLRHDCLMDRLDGRLFFSCLNDGCRAHVEHTSRITHTTPMHRPINTLLLDFL